MVTSWTKWYFPTITSWTEWYFTLITSVVSFLRKKIRRNPLISWKARMESYFCHKHCYHGSLNSYFFFCSTIGLYYALNADNVSYFCVKKCLFERIFLFFQYQVRTFPMYCQWCYLSVRNAIKFPGNLLREYPSECSALKCFGEIMISWNIALLETGGNWHLFPKKISWKENLLNRVKDTFQDDYLLTRRGHYQIWGRLNIWFLPANIKKQKVVQIEVSLFWLP